MDNCNYESEIDREQEVYFTNLADGYWRTRDGRLIHVSKMADGHLLSVDRLLDRVGDPGGFRRHIKAEKSRRF